MISVKAPKTKLKVQTFGHELSWPFDLDNHSVKPPKAKPKVQRLKEHPTLSFIQDNPSNLTAKILLVFKILMKKNRQPLNHSLGLHLSDPNFL
jgi:hypothetical protein